MTVDDDLPGRRTAPAREPAAIEIIDWGRTARRLRLVLGVLGGLVVVLWAVIGWFGDAGFRVGLLAELAGIALLLAFVAEVVVVGGAAIRGMLRAGERGERLAGSDVSLLPPQLGRRRRH